MTYAVHQNDAGRVFETPTWAKLPELWAQGKAWVKKGRKFGLLQEDVEQMTELVKAVIYYFRIGDPRAGVKNFDHRSVAGRKAGISMVREFLLDCGVRKFLPDRKQLSVLWKLVRSRVQFRVQEMVGLKSRASSLKRVAQVLRNYFDKTGKLPSASRLSRLARCNFYNANLILKSHVMKGASGTPKLDLGSNVGPLSSFLTKLKENKRLVRSGEVPGLLIKDLHPVATIRPRDNGEWTSSPSITSSPTASKALQDYKWRRSKRIEKRANKAQERGLSVDRLGYAICSSRHSQGEDFNRDYHPDYTGKGDCRFCGEEIAFLDTPLPSTTDRSRKKIVDPSTFADHHLSCAGEKNRLKGWLYHLSRQLGLR